MGRKKTDSAYVPYDGVFTEDQIILALHICGDSEDYKKCKCPCCEPYDCMRTDACDALFRQAEELIKKYREGGSYES